MQVFKKAVNALQFQTVFERYAAFIGDESAVLGAYSALVRFILPVIAAVILIRCLKSMGTGECAFECWGYLSLPNGVRVPLHHWENTIGRSKSADVYLEYPTLSRSHAAVIRDDTGAWFLFDLRSKGGVLVNGRKVEGSRRIKNGDILNLGGVELAFIAVTPNEAKEEGEEIAPLVPYPLRTWVTLLFLTLFQALLGFQLCIAAGKALDLGVVLSFLALIAMTWLSYLAMRLLRRRAFEVETIALFLSTLGAAITATSVPSDSLRQTGLLAAGIFLYFLLGWFLRDLGRAVRLRRVVAAGGLLLLMVNILAGTELFGAKNWLSIGRISFQPSEFVKIAFVFAGAATMDRLFARRNLYLFVAFAAVCVGALALMGDFGTALVFFVAYLVIAFIRSGDITAVALSVGAAAAAGFLAISIKPHIANRFATWRHAWDTPFGAGYQQTRAMSAAASGGLFGLGAGEGWLKNVFAANTDLVFAMLCEELGFFMAALAVFALLLFVFYTVHYSSSARSSFYVIAASATCAIFLAQMLLNTSGSVDLLPFTGVTFPFVSRGGSSLIASWGLLAFIKCCDTRKNASFALRAQKQYLKKETSRRTRKEDIDVALSHWGDEEIFETDDDFEDTLDFDLEYDDDLSEE
jgi:cell division protein FtsW (lipid II flippase)